MRLPLIVNILLVVAVATTVIGIGLFTNMLAVPGAAATATPPPNTGPLQTLAPSPTPVTTATPSLGPSVGPTVPPGGTYIVQPGDNLTKIANLFGISVDALIAANPEILLPPDYIIHAGDELVIPDPSAECNGYPGAYRRAVQRQPHGHRRLQRPAVGGPPRLQRHPTRRHPVHPGARLDATANARPDARGLARSRLLSPRDLRFRLE
jgi:LysM repeat protein